MSEQGMKLINHNVDLTFSDEQAMVLEQARQFCADKSPIPAVRQLLQSGLEQTQEAPVQVEGRRHGLTCVPIGDSVVCTLSAAGSEAPESWELLTPRERSVLQMLADGETTASAARKLGISSATVRTHVEHMRSKLGAKTRAGLVSLGYRLGFLS